MKHLDTDTVNILKLPSGMIEVGQGLITFSLGTIVVFCDKAVIKKSKCVALNRIKVK